jgi:hypothetical protein
MDTHTTSHASDFSIATVPPTVRQRQLSLIVAAIVLAATGVITAFGATQLQQIDGFIPAIEFVIFVSALFTAALLSSHARIIGSHRLLVRERLFVQRTDSRFACFDFSRCICAVWPPWCRTPDYRVALYLLAFGISRFRNWLCLLERRKAHFAPIDYLLECSVSSSSRSPTHVDRCGAS